MTTMRVPATSNLSEKVFDLKVQSDQRSSEKGYEEGDLEIDSAGSGFDTDCTGNHARSNELYVRKCKKENRTEQGARSYFDETGDRFLFHT